MNPRVHLQPFLNNSLAIRQEIQRFESVHPSIYAIYDLIDLIPDGLIAQRIRDHVVCIEGFHDVTSTYTDLSLSEDEDNLNVLKSQYASEGSLLMKDYPEKGCDIPVSFIKIQLENGKTLIVKKKTLCCLFQTEKTTLSNDRLFRVRGPKPTAKRNMVAPRVSQRRPRRRPSKRVYSSHSDSEGETEEESGDIELNDSSSDDGNNLRNDSSENEVKEVEIEIEMEPCIEQEKYYAIYYEEDWYLGRVIDILGNKIKIKFLKRELEEYLWPKTVDIQTVEKKFIIYGPVGNYPFRLRRSDEIIIKKNYKKIKKL